MAEILELQEEQNIHPPSPKKKGRGGKTGSGGGGDDDNRTGGTGGVGKEKKEYPKGVVLGKDGKPCRSCTSAAAWINLARSSSTPSSSTTTTTSIPLSTQPSSSSSTALDSECPPDVNQLGRSTWAFLHTLAANYPVRPTLQEKSDTAKFMGLFGKLYPCWVCAEDFREWMNRDEYRLVPAGAEGFYNSNPNTTTTSSRGNSEASSSGDEVFGKRFGRLGVGVGTLSSPPPKAKGKEPDTQNIPTTAKTTGWLDSREKFGLWMCMAHNAVNVKLAKPEFDCNKWQERWRTGCGVGDEID